MLWLNWSVPTQRATHTRLHGLCLDILHVDTFNHVPKLIAPHLHSAHVLNGIKHIMNTQCMVLRIGTTPQFLSVFRKKKWRVVSFCHCLKEMTLCFPIMLQLSILWCHFKVHISLNEPRHEKPCLRGLRPLACSATETS